MGGQLNVIRLCVAPKRFMCLPVGNQEPYDDLSCGMDRKTEYYFRFTIRIAEQMQSDRNDLVSLSEAWALYDSVAVHVKMAFVVTSNIIRACQQPFPVRYECFTKPPATTAVWALVSFGTGNFSRAGWRLELTLWTTPVAAPLHFTTTFWETSPWYLHALRPKRRHLR